MKQKRCPRITESLSQRLPWVEAKGKHQVQALRQGRHWVRRMTHRRAIEAETIALSRTQQPITYLIAMNVWKKHQNPFIVIW